MAKKRESIIEELENAVTVEEPTAEDAMESAPASFEGTVICDRLNVRALPDKTSRVVTVLTKGTKVALEKIDAADWYQYTGVGFVMSQFIKEN